MTFGEALEKLKTGSMVTRDVWHGEHFIYLIAPTTTDHPVGDGELAHGPYIARKANGMVDPWFATNSDLLSNDWTEVLS